MRSPHRDTPLPGSRTRGVLPLLALGLAGWALCGAIMVVGLAVTSLDRTLVIHAVGAPLIFAALSWMYFRRWQVTTPLQTAAVFLGIVMGMDFFLVALLINRSLEMFAGVLGTWLPFGLIFLATLLTGWLQTHQRRPDLA